VLRVFYDLKKYILQVVILCYQRPIMVNFVEICARVKQSSQNLQTKLYSDLREWHFVIICLNNIHSVYFVLID
jgi:hypothetical protein